MAYVKTDDKHYKNIGNALRETLGEDSLFQPSDMGEAIRYANEESYNKGIEQGKQAQYDEFWNSIPLNDIGIGSFSGNTWNDETFKPTKDITFRKMTAQWTFCANEITNVKQSLEKQGVKLNTGKLDGFSYCFYTLKTSELPEIEGVINIEL